MKKTRTRVKITKVNMKKETTRTRIVRRNLKKATIKIAKANLKRGKTRVNMAEVNMTRAAMVLPKRKSKERVTKTSAHPGASLMDPSACVQVLAAALIIHPKRRKKNLPITVMLLTLAI